MSKAHAAKNQTSLGQAEDASPLGQAETAAGGSAGAAAVVQPTPPIAPDKHHGEGGLYTMTNGQRVRIARTEAAAPATPKEPQ